MQSARQNYKLSFLDKHNQKEKEVIKQAIAQTTVKIVKEKAKELTKKS